MIRVVVGDLASTVADAVVRPATSVLEPIAEQTRVDQLARSPGWRPLPRHRPLDVGAAVVTDGGALEAEYVVHAVVLSSAKPVITREGIRRAIQSVLERCNDWQFRTLAIPILGGDSTALGLEAGAQILIDTLYGGRAATYPEEVCIVVDSEEAKSVVDAFLRSRHAHES